MIIRQVRISDRDLLLMGLKLKTLDIVSGVFTLLSLQKRINSAEKIAIPDARPAMSSLSR